MLNAAVVEVVEVLPVVVDGLLPDVEAVVLLRLLAKITTIVTGMHGFAGLNAKYQFKLAEFCITFCLPGLRRLTWVIGRRVSKFIAPIT